jgi:hypothetical protein
MKCKKKYNILFPQCNKKPYTTNVLRNELNKCYNGQELPYLCKWKNKKKMKKKEDFFLCENIVKWLENDVWKSKFCIVKIIIVWHLTKYVI